MLEVDDEALEKEWLDSTIGRLVSTALTIISDEQKERLYIMLMEDMTFRFPMADCSVISIQSHRMCSLRYAASDS